MGPVRKLKGLSRLIVEQILEVVNGSFRSDVSFQVKTEDMLITFLRLRLTWTTFKDLFRTAQ